MPYSQRLGEILGGTDGVLAGVSGNKGAIRVATRGGKLSNTTILELKQGLFGRIESVRTLGEAYADELLAKHREEIEAIYREASLRTAVDWLCRVAAETSYQPHPDPEMEKARVRLLAEGRESVEGYMDLPPDLQTDTKNAYRAIGARAGATIEGIREREAPALANYDPLPDRAGANPLDRLLQGWRALVAELEPQGYTVPGLPDQFEGGWEAIEDAEVTETLAQLREEALASKGGPERSGTPGTSDSS